MAQNKSTYEVNFSKDYKKAEIIYVKNPDDQKNKDIIDEIYGEENGYPGKVNEPTFLTTFSILFRTENINKPILYYQFNPEFKLSTIIFDIACPYEEWQLNDRSLRPYLIMEEIDNMFNEAKMAGIGTLQFYRAD